MKDIDWDDTYANGAYIADAEGYPPRWAAKAQAFRAAFRARDKCQLDVPYGPHDRERFDLFLPDAAPRGLVVIVHGGYWLAFDKSWFSHLAAGAIARDFAVAVPSYVLAPEVPIAMITQQIASAINTASGMIPGPIHLAGHSAGGHLVTRMLCSDITWPGCFPARIARVVSISGVHDLRPLRNTEMNANFKMDATGAAAESPLLHKDHLPIPVVAWVGGDERPVFIEQSQWLARDWQNADVMIESGKHHFDVIDGLEDANSPLMNAVLG